MPQETLQLGSDTLLYTLRRSRRAKRLLLHVDISGEVELVVPWHASYAEGRQFLREKHAWIQKQRLTQAARQAEVPRRVLVSGASLPCFGQAFTLTICSGNRSRAVAKDDRLIVTALNDEGVRACVQAWYRRRARTFFTGQVQVLTQQLGVDPATIRITGARTLWGSCNPHRRSISFTWRLALAPREVAAYVAAHEVAHLRYARHGKRFWQLVTRLYPEYEASWQFLRTHGHTLEL